MIHGILVAHGSVGEGLLGAVRAMYGKVEGLDALSNEGLSTPELVDRIRETAAAADDGVCIFTDAFGGSCWRAAKTARIPGSVVLTGFNLPMILSFVTKRDTVPFSDLPAVLETDAKRGITVEVFPGS